MEPSPTRRELLGGLVAVGAAAGVTAVGVEATAGPTPTFDPWEPETGAWPAARRGPRRTAAAPEATPPSRAPEVEWTAETDTRMAEAGASVVVADGVAFLGGEPRVVAVDVEDGRSLWSRDAFGGRLCARDGTLYCGARGAGIEAVDAPDGERSWAVEFEAGEPIYDVLAVDGSLLVGRHGWLEGRDPERGDRRWRVNVGGLGSVFPAVVDDRLYVGGPGPLETYGSREGWDAVLERGPRQVAEGRGPVFGHYPAIDEEGVYVGGFDHSDGTALYGFARSGAERRWIGPEAPAIRSPAIAGDVGVVRTYDVETSRFRLLGVDLGDGSTDWRRPQRADLTDPVVAGDLAVLASAEGDAASAEGVVRAVDPGTGETVWETAIPGSPQAVVPAGERLLVAGRDGTLRSLR